MIFINILSLLFVFIASSWLSGYLLTRFGYPPPKNLASREDYILFAMKIITFMIIVILFLVLFMLIGFDPLNFMTQ